MMKSLRSLSLVVVLCGAYASAQKVNVNSFSGDFQVNGSPYGAGGLEWDDEATLSASDSTSSLTLANGPLLNTFGAYRTMMKFKASSETADYMLPSDNLGGMSAASAGDSRILGTWNQDCMPSADHLFGMSVSESNGDVASIDIDVKEAPQPTVVGTSGIFSVGGLDGSSVDSDPRVGFVKINTDNFPSFSMAFDNVGMTFNRSQIEWSDGSLSNSVFYDSSWQGAWTVFENLSGGNGGIFTQDESNRHTWNPGDAPGNQSFGTYTGTMNMNLASLAWGSYRVKHWAIGWWGIGNTEYASWNCAFGGIEREIVELNVQIVPEPASILALVFGAGVIYRSRRAKARN